MINPLNLKLFLDRMASISIIKKYVRNEYILKINVLRKLILVSLKDVV